MHTSSCNTEDRKETYRDPKGISILFLRILLDGLVEEIAVDPSVNVMTFFITDSHDK